MAKKDKGDFMSRAGKITKKGFRESKKFAIEEKIATYFELLTIFLCSPLVIKINKAPISGINMIAERIGKFI